MPSLWRLSVSTNATNSAPIQTTASAPRERTLRYRVQLALRIAREAEGFEQARFLARDLLRRELADAQHLITMVGVGDDEDVVAKFVEDREAIGSEAAKPARLLVLLVEPDLALEALLAMRQHGAPAVHEIIADDEIGTVRSVRVDGDVVRILIHQIGRRAALYAAEIEIRLVIETPELVGDDGAVDIG